MTPGSPSTHMKGVRSRLQAGCSGDRYGVCAVARSETARIYAYMSIGADGGTRTRTSLGSRDFKSLVSTGSTTSAEA